MDPYLYASWRAASPFLAALRETVDPPPERLLQQIWRHQRIIREGLLTTDGHPIQVLHPGFWNREAGPDFRGAVLQFADHPPRSGDVELDLHPAGWRAHGHHTNPAYSRVILHVIWDTPAQRVDVGPTLPLRPYLDAPLLELADWAASGDLGLPLALAGQCQAPLRDLPPEQSAEILRQAARERLRHKAEVLRARAKRAGWEQALWEGLFTALGYKQNPWAMRRVAELLPRLRSAAQSSANHGLAWQARLLGVAGLLPDQGRAAAQPQVRLYWDHWWRERDALTDVILPSSLWRLAGVRPANHPTRRLALAAHWLSSGQLPRKLTEWWEQTPTQRCPWGQLLRVLQPEADPFWSRQWTFRAAAGSAVCPLIGPPRAADLAVNVILPWFHARAVSSRHRAWQKQVDHLFEVWPACEDNVVLRQARQRLFGHPSPHAHTAAAQQGLLQITRDFCDHSNALCDECRFPKLVRRLGRPDS